MSFENIYNLLNDRFDKYNFDPGHKLGHALVVASHAYSALIDFPYLTKEQKDAILLACVLHDANDHKFIKDKADILDIEELLKDHANHYTITLTIVMIDNISCSKNGDSHLSPTWLAIPRYADRLEAMGKIGLKRAISFASHEGRPFIDISTERAYSEEDLNLIATKKRYKEYIRGERVSTTTMDHLYDKVLHLTIPTWLGSPTLESIAYERQLWLRKYIINYFNASSLNYIV